MKHAERIPVRAFSFARWAPVASGRNTDRAHEATARQSDVHPHRLEVIPSLDGIRAISVLIVVLGHSGLEALVPGGLGVTIFFFLSGYLITTLMLTEHKRTGGINILNFYTRRVFRLMPPLLVSLAIAYGLTYAGLLSGGVTSTGLAAQLLYFANYYGLFFDPGNTIPDGTGILWSLAVEEHFYIVYPLLMTLMLGSALRPRTIGALLGIGCLVVLAWRIHLVQSPGFVSDRTYYASDTRIDSIIYGCILAVVTNPRQQPHRRSYNVLGSVGSFGGRRRRVAPDFALSRSDIPRNNSIQHSRARFDAESSISRSDSPIIDFSGNSICPGQ